MNLFLAAAHIADSIPIAIHYGPAFVRVVCDRIVWEIIGAFLDNQIHTTQCVLGITCRGV